MLIKKAYKFRLYPNKTQQKQFAKEFGAARYVYNYFLNRRIKVYEQTKKGLTYNQNAKELTQLKKNEEYIWLQENSAIVLQQSLKDLDIAYRNFFRRIKQGKVPGFPKFKSKHGKQTFRLSNTAIRFDYGGSKARLAKIGWVKMVNYCPVLGRILNATISKTKSGKYFISIATEQEIEPKKKECTNKEIGIDLGLKSFIVTSEGLKIEPPKFFIKKEKQLRLLQREFCRREKGSKNREKSRIKIAILHEKIAAQRANFLHCLTSTLTSNYNYIALEDLNVQGMQSNRYLSKSIADASWSEFIRQLQYKGIWNSCEIVKIGRFDPSSKTCFNCGYINQELTLGRREWTCPGCGQLLDRDINAAKNILEFSRERHFPEVNACGDQPVRESLKQEYVLGRVSSM